MNEQLIIIAALSGTMIVMVAGMLLLVAKFWRRVKASEALVVTSPRGTFVMRSGGLVFPFIQTSEVVDLTAKTIPVACCGRESVATKDGIRVDVEVTFSMRVDEVNEDILLAVKRVGATHRANAKALEELFGSRLARAVADVVRKFSLDDLEKDRERIEDELIVAGREDLHGFVLDRVVIARVEPTPGDTVGPFR